MTPPPPLYVVDTNVVVAGLLTRQEDAPTARILDAMIRGELRFALSVELLAEYRAVLLRPRIRRRHGLDAGEIDRVLEALARNAVVVRPESAAEMAPDPGDQHLWNLIAALPGSALVTGDAALARATTPCVVLAPAEVFQLPGSSS